ncbi:MAG: hypothetical protein K2P79_07510 [Sphingomonas sp.]|nr:hypothetical protein [Sphingomonas sp.]
MKAGYLIAAAMMVAATPAAAQSVFDGTWKGDIASAQLPTKPWVRSLKGGVYSCECDTPLSVKADGQFHPVSGQSYFDSMMVKVIDDHRLASESRKGGKLVYVSTDSVSADGMTNEWTSKDYSAPNGMVVDAKGRDKRAGALPPKGAHMITGGWLATNDGYSTTDAALYISFKSVPGGITMSTKTGQSYTAMFGGPEVVMQGDPGKTMIKLRKISDTSFEETDSRDGKVRTVYTYVALPDGKTVDVTVFNPIQNTTSKFKAFKQ